MIELHDDKLLFRFPDVHRDAVLRIDFQRTLRIPDDDQVHHLPPGLSKFPLQHVDDFAVNVSDGWIDHGGVMLPMYQSEAMWIQFDPQHSTSRHIQYPFAVKIAAGKINAVTGGSWDQGLQRDPQDYLSLPGQRWLDGYCVKKGIIRQFVAMPLGSGYSAEEQLTGKAAHGGLQVMVCPMKRRAYKRRFPKYVERLAETQAAPSIAFTRLASFGASDMGLAPGGQMRQTLYDDAFKLEDWDTRNASRCFVHIANSLVWRDITGQDPPTTPPTAREYTRAGLPWFEYYGEGSALGAGAVLKRLKSVAALGLEKGDNPLPENASIRVRRVVTLRKGLRRGEVREN